MNEQIRQALVQGAERVAAWADLLDSINVFPVADGDTGRNLKISLSPLRDQAADRERMVHLLLLNARGNSGNIAARFFSGFLTAADPAGLPAAARLGRERAWQAVHDPRPGTMLTLFDALADSLEGAAPSPASVSGIISRLETAVRSTTDLLPKLKEAGVVDAGALGMFIFFEGFLGHLAGDTAGFKPVTEVFGGRLAIAASFKKEEEEGYCIDITLDAGKEHDAAAIDLARLGESVVVIPGEEYLKVHLHAANAADVRNSLESMGRIVRWSDDDLSEQVRGFGEAAARGPVHIMTDAAGSVTRDDARRLGFTLLDSYITVGDIAAPETCVDQAELYAAMRRGEKTSTSQASDFERGEIYRSVTGRHDRVLYVCVGSAFTGNFGAATRWKEAHDPEGKLTVIDTGAASGRLGAIAIAAARYAASAGSAEEIFSFTRRAVGQCREYIFIDNLKFLAAGGRISKTRAFFGSMLNMRPIVTPTSEGVIRAGVAKNFDDQLAFALARLADEAGHKPFVLLQYTDNRGLVEERVMPAIASRYPGADIKLGPLSLTTGVHVGPGTWSLAFLPEI
jgi:uncharacterized protein